MIITMNKQTVSTLNAPAAIGPYSQGVMVGNLIFTSGQLPMNPQSGELVPDIDGATKQSLDNVKAISRVRRLFYGQNRENRGLPERYE